MINPEHDPKMASWLTVLLARGQVGDMAIERES
jgi:hypothetical protein